MILKAVAVLLTPLVANAQPYIEVGVGAATGGCLYHSSATTFKPVAQRGVMVIEGCSRDPLGLFAVGYEFNDRWRIQWDHWSSIPDVDRGVDILSVRYRHTFK